MAYLQISTRVTVTAPISVWEDVRTYCKREIDAIDEDDVTDTTEWHVWDIVYEAVRAKLIELRLAQNRRTNASWDYDYPLSIDNLTPDEVDIIKAAWEARA